MEAIFALEDTKEIWAIGLGQGVILTIAIYGLCQVINKHIWWN